MIVVKRNGKEESFSYQKVKARIKAVSIDPSPLSTLLDVDKVASMAVAGMKDRMTTFQLDQLVAETAASLTTEHYDYGVLAARVAVSNLHKSTPKTFSECVEMLYNNVDPNTGEDAPAISDTMFELVHKHTELLNDLIVHTRDYEYDFFGFNTLQRSYLLKSNGKIVERPQYMILRVALAIHQDDLEAVARTYQLMSTGHFTHATPTLFNAGTRYPQMSSCFLLANEADSLDGIFNTIHDVARISKYSGGIGVHLHNVRAKGSYIRGTGGRSDGLLPLLRVYNGVARYINQSGKRKGAIAIYLEPWHPDFMDFLEIRKNNKSEEARCLDLFTAVWMNDLFMERLVEAVQSKNYNIMWSFFCPDSSPGLSDVYGDAFRELYISYETKEQFVKQLPVLDVWSKILELQVESGTPYLVNKDRVNEQSNQKNIGVIKSLNLCAEVAEVSTPEQIAVCNLASVALPKFVQDGMFDFARLGAVVGVVIENLNRVIDLNFYPSIKAESSNKINRPVGLGVQGLADTFSILGYPFESEEAKDLNQRIAETIYYYALKTSHKLAKRHGAYDNFVGSPLSEGLFQFDMTKKKPSFKMGYDWNTLREEIQKDGVRNSLLIAQMPVATTASILGNSEANEPHMSNVYARRVLAGEYIVVNKYLMQTLIHRGIWNERIKHQILANNGSIQNIDEIPNDVKALYKTVWEISQKVIIDHAADRQPFICQSQSMNLFLEDPSNAQLTSMHIYAWRRGLKTCCYYLRTRPAVDAIKYTVNTEYLKKSETMTAGQSCTIDCESCSS